jgi:outer membrane murein-binding lipoprotein Lpp
MSHPGSDDYTTAGTGDPAQPADPPAPAVPPQNPPQYVPPPVVPTYSSSSPYEPQPPVYQPPPQPTYQPAPTPTYEPAPQPTYEPAPAPTYEPAPTPAPSSPETPAATPAPTYSTGAAAVPAAADPVKAPTPPSYDATVVGQAYAAQQYSAQPYPGQAYPGQAYPGQYPGQQYSAPPVSAPYAYAMQAGLMGVPPQPKKGRAGIIVLSILTAVFLVSTGVLGTLFIMRTSDANDLSAQVTKLDADNKANAAKANALQKDVDSAKRDLTDAKTQADEMSRQRGVLADCLNAIIDENAAFAAAGRVETAEVKAKEAVTNTKCNLATKLL